MMWITDRLPSRDGEYIVTCKGAIYATALFFEDGKWVLNAEANEPNIIFEVVAWMPMPKAYGGK